MATNFFRARRWAFCITAALLIDGMLFDGAPLGIAAPPARTSRFGTAPSSRRPTTTAPQTNVPQTAIKPKANGNVFAPPPLPDNTTGKTPASTPAPPQPQREAEKTTGEVLPDANGKYLFRYRFSNGEMVRWQVEHTAKIVTSVQGSTQTAETVTVSRKAWKVVETRPGGETRFVHAVEAIQMKQKLTGRQETIYDSETDKEAPPIFAEAAKQVGVPLAEVTIDPRGQVIKREDKQKRPEGSPTNTITVVLPDVPLAIGESWTSPFEIKANDSEGNVKTIAARHKLTLEKVEDGIAVLKNETQILSPLTDPQIEAQVVQSETSGRVSFDLRHGRITSQDSDLDKEVFGFQGPESKLHYTARFRETLNADKQPLTAAGPKPTQSTK